MKTEEEEFEEIVSSLPQEQQDEIRKQAESGVPGAAEYALAWALLYQQNWCGKTAPFDTWLRRAMRKGHTEAMCDHAALLGSLYRHVSWYRKAAALGSGRGAQKVLIHYNCLNNSAQVLRHLRRYLRQGIKPEAFEWFTDTLQLSAEERERELGIAVLCELGKAGHAASCYDLGRLFYFGELRCLHVVKSLALALTWWKRGAALGHAGCCFELGLMYEHGEGTRRNRKRAFRCYEKSAELGNLQGLTNLGYAYYWGIGCKKDVKRCVSMFEQAVAKGDTKVAAYNLASRYYHGEGVPKDFERAWHYLRLSAKHNYPDALTRMGTMTLRGEGTEKDIPAGIELLQRAVKNGGAWAKQELGLCYERGQGVPRDILKAFELVSQARAEGWRYTTRDYNRLRRKTEQEEQPTPS